jgi:hypothetical protein
MNSSFEIVAVVDLIVKEIAKIVAVNRVNRILKKERDVNLKSIQNLTIEREKIRLRCTASRKMVDHLRFKKEIYSKKNNQEIGRGIGISCIRG